MSSMIIMNNLQEVLNHLVKRDTLVFLFGGKRTVFAMYGIIKISIGEPVITIDCAFIQSIKKEIQDRNTTKNKK